jgi:hypothetical protein
MNTINQKVHALLELAMMVNAQGGAYAFVGFSGHINGLFYYARPADQADGGDDDREHLIDMQYVYLDWDNANEQLDSAISQFQALMREDAA